MKLVKTVVDSIEKKMKVMTLVFFSGTMDKAYAMLTLATAAASMGYEVNVYFTFWGLGFLKKRKKFLKKNFLQKIMEYFLPAGAAGLPTTYMNMLGAGTALMKKMIRKSNAASIEQLDALASELGVNYYACSASCKIMGTDPAGLRKGVKGVAGAAAYINMAQESGINLFI